MSNSIFLYTSVDHRTAALASPESSLDVWNLSLRPNLLPLNLI